MIAPFAKSGTTWLQHIAHGIRSGGDMRFEEISFIVPWIDMMQAMGTDSKAPQGFEPRLFKTHSAWKDVPKGARYTCAFRDPQEVVVSYYRFMENWFFEPGAIDLDAFARTFLPPEGELGRSWQHMVSWWKRRHDNAVLLLVYQDMDKGLAATVRDVAQLMQFPLSDAVLETVVRQSSRDYLLAHASHFDERGIRQLAWGEDRIAVGQ